MFLPVIDIHVFNNASFKNACSAVASAGLATAGVGGRACAGFSSFVSVWCLCCWAQGARSQDVWVTLFRMLTVLVWSWMTFAGLKSAAALVTEPGNELAVEY